MPGPIPNRSDQRRRRNKPEGSISTGPSAAVVVAPEPNPMWHATARSWYESLGQSGQTAYYQPSDWMVAYVWAEVLSQQLVADRMSAVMIQAWSSSASELLTTEGARRRARLELERTTVQSDPDEDAADEAMNVYHAQFGA